MEEHPNQETSIPVISEDETSDTMAQSHPDTSEQEVFDKERCHVEEHQNQETSIPVVFEDETSDTMAQAQNPQFRPQNESVYQHVYDDISDEEAASNVEPYCLTVVHNRSHCISDALAIFDNERYN